MAISGGGVADGVEEGSPAAAAHGEGGLLSKLAGVFKAGEKLEDGGKDGSANANLMKELKKMVADKKAESGGSGDM